MQQKEREILCNFVSVTNSFSKIFHLPSVMLVCLYTPDTSPSCRSVYFRAFPYSKPGSQLSDGTQESLVH